MSDHMFSLLERHQRLDRMLAGARRKRWPDPMEVSRLKKLKLAIKDRIAREMRRTTRTA